MKKILLFPLVLTLLLTACNDDDDIVPEERTVVEEQLIGNWLNNVQVQEFYNGKDEVVYGKTDTVEVIHELNGKTMVINDVQSGNTLTLTYEVSDTSGTSYISFFRNGTFENSYRIASINDANMVWEREVPYEGYPSGDSIRISRRAIYRYHFLKQ